MKFYLVRHTEAVHGDPMDVERTLTDIGRAQIPLIIDFLKTQTKKIGVVICSDMRRGIDTAEPIAKALDVEVVRDPFVGPNYEPAEAWKHIVKLAKTIPDQEVLIVSHGKLVNKLAAWLLESGEGDKFHFSHGSVAHFDTEEPDNYGPYNGGYKGQPAFMHWMVTPKLLNRFNEEDPKAVIEAALRLAGATLESLGLQFDEARGEYYYDIEEVKRWILGPGGVSGVNCEGCEGNAELGWIGMDELFTEAAEDVDEPPAHPNCECTVEYRSKRVRVYV